MSFQQYPKEEGKEPFMEEPGKELFLRSTQQTSHVSPWPDWITCPPLDQQAGCLPSARLPAPSPDLHSTIQHPVQASEDFRFPTFPDWFQPMGEWGTIPPTAALGTTSGWL